MLGQAALFEMSGLIEKYTWVGEDVRVEIWEDLLEELTKLVLSLVG